MKKIDRFTAVSMVALSAAIGVLPAQAARFDDPVVRGEARQPMNVALQALSLKFDVQIASFSEDVFGRSVRKLSGEYTLTDGLSALLKDSGLRYIRVDDRTIAVGTYDRLSTQYAGSIVQTIGFNTTSDYQDNLAVSEEDEKKDEIEELEEVVVTGSHIRGVGPVGSQVLVFDRKDIDLKGYSTIPEFIRSLPQNFNGGASESTSQLSFENGAANNINEGTGINLRGLGNVSTLVLLNGQRLAPSGLNGSFVDISMIPLSAIETVEILTDGASAIYGSDAIGGVVNFKMRKDYDGAETRVRYGGATGGGLEEVLIGQTFGKVWDQGHGLLSYEYSHRDALDARDRDFTKDAPVPNDLLPEQERHSVFFTGGHHATEDLEFFTTAYFNKRDSERKQFLSLVSTPGFSQSETKQYGGTFGSALGLDNSLGNDWRAELVGSYSRSEFVLKTRDLAQTESDNRIVSRVSKNWSADINLDGTIFSMPGGDAKLAIGGH